MLFRESVTKPIAHAVASCGIGMAVWAWTRSFTCAAASVIAGICIDIDHIIDYFWDNRITADLGAIYRAYDRLEYRHIYILFHSYEALALLWAAVFWFGMPPLWLGIAIGCTHHLLLDQLTNIIVTPGYFLTYRVRHSFKKEALIDKDKEEAYVKLSAKR